jgi:hypothetical protein
MPDTSTQPQSLRQGQPGYHPSASVPSRRSLYMPRALSLWFSVSSTRQLDAQAMVLDLQATRIALMRLMLADGNGGQV